MNGEKIAWPQHISLKNGSRLTLRPAVPEDAPRLLAYVELVAGESENLAFGPGEFGMNLEQEQAVLQQIAEAPTSLYLLGEIEGEIAGILTFNAERRLRLQHAGEFGMSVLRKYWNLGLGSHLLAALLSWAAQTDVIRKVDLRVRVDNLPAIHLYEKFGFVHEGRKTREFYLYGQFYDVFLMDLPLDPASCCVA